MELQILKAKLCVMLRCGEQNNNSKAVSSSSQSSPQVRPVVIVVSPLNALIKDQIRRISQGNLTAAALNV